MFGENTDLKALRNNLRNQISVLLNRPDITRDQYGKLLQIINQFGKKLNILDYDISGKSDSDTHLDSDFKLNSGEVLVEGLKKIGKKFKLESKNDSEFNAMVKESSITDKIKLLYENIDIMKNYLNLYDKQIAKIDPKYLDKLENDDDGTFSWMEKR